MKYSARIGTKLATAMSLLTGGVCVTGSADAAERIRHCAYSFGANVETEDIDGKIVRREVLLVRGNAAGRHGGVQANKARNRARNAIRNCLAQWNRMSVGQKSSDLAVCTNRFISSVPGFDVETNGHSLRETIAEFFPNLCENLALGKETLVRVSDASLLVSGDKGCPTSSDYSAEEMLLGEFCQGL